MRKFLTKIFIRNLLIALVLVSALIFSCFYYYNSITEKLYAEASDRIVSETSYCASLMQTDLENSLEEVISCSYSLSNANVSKEEVLSFLEFYSNKSKYLRFSYFDMDGNLTGTDNVTTSIAGLPIHEKTKQGLPSISVPTLDASKTTEIVAISSPVPLGGKPSYGIVGSLYLSTLYSKLSDSFYDGKGYSYIVSSKGDIIVRPKHKDYVGDYDNILDRIAVEAKGGTQLADATKGFSGGQSGLVSYPIDNKTKMISYAPIEGINDWFMVCVIPNYTIPITGREIVNYPLIVFSLATACIALAFLYIIRREETNRLAMMQLAFTDRLTGVSNLDKFKLDVTKLMSKKKNLQLALIKFDVDNFKLINDIFGFEVGDHVLISIAASIKFSLTEDELFARVANDDFIILIHYTSDKDIIARSKKLVESFKKNCHELVNNYKMDFSTGVYKIEPDESIAVAIEKATMVQKLAKSVLDGTTLFYDDSMRESALKSKDIENTMQAALDNGEFVVYIQPKYGLSNETVQGGEALVRWKHPTKGLIPPMEFIPLFEHNGFIVQLDLFVLERVCKLQRELLDSGKEMVPISINQSKMLIIQPLYSTMLMDIVEKYNLPANLIEIELTETTIHDNIKLLLDLSTKLMKKGFVISIDDFGSGYSSLNLLKDIPANVLKIDREFLNTSEYSQRGQVVLANIIRLAKDLNMVVVTEGVETIEQIDMLKALGCQMAQGYYYARPQPIDDFVKSRSTPSESHFA